MDNNQNELKHYGTPRHSGRYPWGSGENPYQRYKSFHAHVQKLKSQGMTETQIASGMGMNTAQLRARISIAKDEIKKEEIIQSRKLKDKGWSNVAIAKKLDVSEATIRNYLKPHLEEKANVTKTVANVLKDAVTKKTYVDVGEGTERHMGISADKLKTAIALCKEEGYTQHNIKVEQLGTGKYTTIKVLAPPGTTIKDVYQNKDKIKLVTDYSENGGKSFLGLERPVSINSNRIKINYAEDGGKDKDGVIELRRGVSDISLGNAKYAQVRIAVDDTHYLKGMAVYNDHMPDGVDVMFNTNKHVGTPKMDVLKEMKKKADGSVDWDNPFGASIKGENDLLLAQRHYIDNDGNKKLSSINIVTEEGDWGNWTKTISSQFLSKQTPGLAKKQLDLMYKSKEDEYKEIMSLTNPAVKKKLLDSLGDDCDASAVHLKAASFPRQSWNAILPMPSLSEKEIYAPNYENGEKVVLIRYPHAGIFEIPELTVNNNNKEARKLLGNVKDAVGIHPYVAETLSGADFDGDTVLVIPNNNGQIKTKDRLKGLIGYDPKEKYPAYEGMPKVSKDTGFDRGKEMGKISNLITDMTVMRASDDEIERAVKHSMTVIDAEKHNLDWRRSEVENGIKELKKKYRGAANKGASTLISRAKSPVNVRSRKYISPDPETGEKRYIEEPRYSYKTGKELFPVKSTKMAEAKDAYTLTSGGSKANPGTIIEGVYAQHANKLKALGNECRKSSANIKYNPYSKSAAKVYEKEVASLNAKLNIAMKNKPFERQAQLLSNITYEAKLKDNPNMSSDQKSKIRGQALSGARDRVGAKKQQVDITPKEWEAIQSGAISKTKLLNILDNTDMDKVKEYATPRKVSTVPEVQVSRIRALAANPKYTVAEIAKQLGVSTSTVYNVLDS